MYEWPTHYPNKCPPEDAKELHGSVFRFINKKTPREYDFMSHYERDPNGDWSSNPCNACGLSVAISKEDCEAMRLGVPALRRKRVAMATIHGGKGLIAPTPSKTCAKHHTWWLTIKASDAVALFLIVEFEKEAPNA